MNGFTIMKNIIAKQYRDKVNSAFHQLTPMDAKPKEGWIRTVRKALGMSGVQLAKRLSLSKMRVSQAERDELLGGVSLKTMQSMAEAMNCKFVYAIIPKDKVETLIKRQAEVKARQLVQSASTHMALEAQSLNKEQLAFEVDRIAKEFMEKIPSDLWNDQ